MISFLLAIIYVSFVSLGLPDALLGAAGLRDIGYHFPDTDMRYKGADSRVLLREVKVKLHAEGFRVGNVDVTIIAQAPKMRPHIDTMRANIAGALKLDVEQVNVKATTEEGMGFTGDGRGISAQAVCLVETPTNLFNENVNERKCESCGGCSKA